MNNLFKTGSVKIQETFLPSKKGQKPKPLVHQDSESLHDPTYDHDHFVAHGQTDLERIRTMSLSHQVSFSSNEFIM
jgi:hypothetical protein